MDSRQRPISRFFLGLLLPLFLGSPLAAQLDPRLQSGKTDFLDLYQQSTSTKAKPEIVTVFDYSRSMASLMFHPLYQNNDKLDQDDYRYMKFQLTNAGGGSASNNQYTLTAVANNCSGATSKFVVTVSATGAVGVATPTPPICNTGSGANSAPTLVVTASAAGNSSAASTVTGTAVSSTTTNTAYNASASGSAGTKGTAPGTYTLSAITMSPASGPYAAGSAVTLTVYLTHPFMEGEDITHKNINWNLSGGGSLGTATWTEVSSGYYKSVVTWTIVKFTYKSGTTGVDTQLTPIVSTPGTFAPGDTISLNSYFAKAGTSTKITWSVSGTNNCTTVSGVAGGDGGAANITNATASSGSSVTWKVPAYCSTPGATTPAYVTVTLDPRAGAYSVPGISYLSAVLTAGSSAAPTSLIKPDGTAVVAADADAAKTSSPLRYGASAGKSDVRNWIRAASHVRFSTTVSGVVRTIDVPIPWKIIASTSTTSPLASAVVTDRQAKVSTAADGTKVTTNYGSNLSTELDESFKIENVNGSVFTSDTNGTFAPSGNQSAVYLYTVLYRPAYISWLFTGKYQSDSTKPNYTTDSSLLNNFIIFDAVGTGTSKGAGQSLPSWGQGFGPVPNWGNVQVPHYNADGTYNGSGLEEASKYRIPTMTRLQATKAAAISTWIQHQADVFWAFRFLDPDNEAGATGSNTTLTNDSTTTVAAGDATVTHVNGNDSGWKVLNNTAAQTITATNGNSVIGMHRIASMFANSQTPLTYAMARTLAQFTDPNSVFNAVVGSDVSQCANSYLILFTDGVDNNGLEGTTNSKTGTPYISGTGNAATFNALTGNQTIITNKTSVDRLGDYWNLYTFAAIGAHLADTSLGTAGTDYLDVLDPGTSTTTAIPSALLPLAIKKRNGVTYSKPHRVTTMTVGVSLGGQYVDASSPKRSLFLAAAMGDPGTNSGTLTDFHTFVGPVFNSDGTVAVQNDWIPDVNDPSSYPTYGAKKTGAVYFFDATDPDKLSTSLNYALLLAIGSGGNNATASPNLPYIGASLGKQVYLGRFQPPKAGGVIWPGDLLMYGTRETADQVAIIDKSGNIATKIDQDTAQWSAAKALAARTWSDRNHLYTRLPGTAKTPEPGLKPFTDIGTDYTDGTLGLKNFVAVPAVAVGSDEQKAIIQYAAGANLTGPKDPTTLRPTTNRLNIMGDIINSAPAALEYKFTDSTIVNGLTDHPALSGVGGNRFRLILVGTNQGWLHAFGEVTTVSTVTDSSGTSQEIVTGAVDELWSFMPTDFLANLNYAYGASSTNNSHRFMVDGTPDIYLLDLPPSAGGTGNGILDYNADASKAERAIAIIGLGKGGRSYYALDVKDPFNPVLKWSLVPDEATNFPDSRRKFTSMTIGDLQTLIGNMGYSTCTPGFGRVAFTASGVTTLKDAVFLGGGLSVPEVDHNFPVYPNPPVGQSTPLGRSVLALDVNTGDVLGAANLPTGSGPVVAGLVPFEFFLNSGMAQRAYFLDRSGGLWSWGSKGTPASGDPTYTTYKDYRVDTSDLAKWTVDGTAGNTPGIRRVAQDGSGKDAIYTTLPAPFRVGSFPGKGKDGAVAPAAVGIAMISGDRYNPLDYQYFPITSKPDQHRLTVVFDRQDSRVWGLDSQAGPDTGITDSRLSDFTGNTANSLTDNLCSNSIYQYIKPGCDSFYLAPKTGNPNFGYKISLAPAIASGDLATKFVTKGINPPMVVAGSLYYTAFTPTSADPCTGGNGNSISSFIADVYSPLVVDTSTSSPNRSGIKLTWSGVASNFFAFGTRGVLQGGTTAVANPSAGSPQTVPEMKTILGRVQERYPKARVWRTVQ